MLVAGFEGLVCVTSALGHPTAVVPPLPETRKTRPASAGRVSMRCEAADYEM